MARTDLGKIGMTFLGAYSAATAYELLDAVTHDGSSYVCVAASTANLPTNATYWQLLAAKGDTGAAGVDGNGAGDMLKSVYDTDNDGVVNDVPGLETRLSDVESAVDGIETLLAAL